MEWKLCDYFKDERMYSYSISKNPRAVNWLRDHPEYIHCDSLLENVNGLELLLEMFDMKKLNWKTVAGSPHVCKLLPRKPRNSYWRWKWLSGNPYALPYLEPQLPLMNWHALSANPAAINLIERNLHQVDWTQLSKNHNATPLLLQHVDKIDWVNFCKNTHPDAIRFLGEHVSNINWSTLSTNPSAIPLLKQYVGNVCWGPFSSNARVMDLIHLCENVDDLNWYSLSANPNAFPFLMQHQECIVNSIFCRNPSIFVYDYDTMRKKRSPLKEELTAYYYHPMRIQECSAKRMKCS
jgi:hypothetical protein